MEAVRHQDERHERDQREHGPDVSHGRKQDHPQDEQGGQGHEEAHDQSGLWFVVSHGTSLALSSSLISSMTRQERRKPDILKASRKKRIAAGSGTRVEDVNRLLKMHRQMADMMKAMGKGKGGLAKLFGMGGGMPAPSPEELAAMQQGDMPKTMPKLPPMPGGLPGLGAGGLPPGLGGPGGLPGLPKGFIKKK